MVDAFHIKGHPHALVQKGELGRAKGGLNSKLHIAVDAHGNPV
ncbi:hypothetical protein [Nitrosococcus oceani]|nr:hypothetical protein [Nitrosococcus oceani]